MKKEAGSKMMVVARYEFLTTLKRRSTLFMMFGLPILTTLLVSGLNWLAGRQGGDASGNILSAIAFGSAEEVVMTGLVDQSGRIQNYPPPTDEFFRALPDEAAAQAAFEAGEIGSYLVVPADFLETGDVTLYAEESNFNDQLEQQFFLLLATNYLEDPVLIQRVMAPADLQGVNLGVREGNENNEGTSFVLGIGVAVLFYLTAMGSGQLLQSLGKEKENRVMEILLSSMRPIDLLVGKLIGLSGVSLLQMVIWGVIALLFLGRGSSPLSNIALPQLEPAVWIIILAHFVAGYLVYSGLFAGLGAIAPNPKESGQISFLMMLPVIIPMWFSSIIINAPSGTFTTALSLFPLTAPITMPMRLALTNVPGWQWVFSLTAALLTSVGTLALAARVFRSQALLSGQKLTWQLAWQLVKGG
jgi:ABC-2 type transport system permease protein